MNNKQHICTQFHEKGFTIIEPIHIEQVLQAPNVWINLKTFGMSIGIISDQDKITVHDLLKKENITLKVSPALFKEVLKSD